MYNVWTVINLFILYYGHSEGSSTKKHKEPVKVKGLLVKTKG